MQGEAGPSSASAGVPPPPPASLDSAQPQGSRPPAPPAGLCPCPSSGCGPSCRRLLELQRPVLGLRGASSSVQQYPKGARSRPFSHLARLCHGHLQGSMRSASSAPAPALFPPLPVPPWPTCWLSRPPALTGTDPDLPSGAGCLLPLSRPLSVLSLLSQTALGEEKVD